MSGEDWAYAVAGCAVGIILSGCWATFVGLLLERGKTVTLHPITVKLKPFPAWDRFRVAAACLLLGEVSFSGEVTDVQAKK